MTLIAAKNTYAAKVPSAQHLEDLTLIEADLLDTMKYTRHLLEMDHPRYKQAMAEAALIRYRRCFTSGCRYRIPINELYSIADGAKELHTTLMLITDRLIAHPVSALEQAAAQVSIENDTVNGLVVLTVFGDHMSDRQVGLFNNWIELILEKIVQPQLSETFRKVRSELDAMSIDEIKQMGPVIFHERDEKTLAKKRR